MKILSTTDTVSLPNLISTKLELQTTYEVMNDQKIIKTYEKNSSKWTISFFDILTWQKVWTIVDVQEKCTQFSKSWYVVARKTDGTWVIYDHNAISSKRAAFDTDYDNIGIDFDFSGNSSQSKSEYWIIWDTFIALKDKTRYLFDLTKNGKFIKAFSKNFEVDDFIFWTDINWKIACISKSAGFLWTFKSTRIWLMSPDWVIDLPEEFNKIPAERVFTNDSYWNTVRFKNSTGDQESFIDLKTLQVIGPFNLKHKNGDTDKIVLHHEWEWVLVFSGNTTKVELINMNGKTIWSHEWDWSLYSCDYDKVNGFWQIVLWRWVGEEYSIMVYDNNSIFKLATIVSSDNSFKVTWNWDTFTISYKQKGNRTTNFYDKNISNDDKRICPLSWKFHILWDNIIQVGDYDLSMLKTNDIIKDVTSISKNICQIDWQTYLLNSWYNLDIILDKEDLIKNSQAVEILDEGKMKINWKIFNKKLIKNRLN